ncbi:MAG: type II toxin-antitoxin system RelE/ParE family toxin [Bacteroidota bacterium]
MAQIYQVVITDRAKESLRKIIAQVRERASIEVARKVKDGIENEITSLNYMPTKNSILRGINDKNITYRRILKWSYRIIYTIEEDKLMVIVVEIDYARSNPKKLEDLK